MFGPQQSTLKTHLRVKPQYIENITLFKAESGMFVGDEILYGKKVPMHFDIKITSSKAQVFVIDREVFLRRFPKGCYNELKNIYK